MSFDLDAALGLPFTFTFGGEEYTLPPDVDLAAVTALQDGHPDVAIRHLLGDAQYERITASASVFGARAFTSLMSEYMRYLGISSGESEASSESSPNIGEPSRPTSNVSTESTSSPSSTEVRRIA
jgi:hypothetical protein